MEYKKFELKSNYKPSGDQPKAIEELTQGIKDGLSSQVLLGVTGSGKTFTIANVIANVNRPTLILAHNKTLAAQLCNEFREFFPNNRVEFFVSYYDYYQPEAYIPRTDTYIEKDMSINDEIDKLRHSATCSLFERRDVIVVASVSCIYGLGNPETYSTLSLSLRPNDEIDIREVIKKLISMRYERNDIDFKRATFRVKGDILDIFPAGSSEIAIRVEFFGDVVENIYEIDAVTNTRISKLEHLYLLPASHFAVEQQGLEKALSEIQKDKEIRVAELENQHKLVEAQRLNERVSHDIEMIREMGYCNGIENYSRYFDGRQPGEAPYVLLDYFPDDFLLIVDESHITIPQVRAMYKGDLSRKTNLVDYGFRLPAAYDNRPLTFEEFNARIPQAIYVSATPAKYELEKAGQVVEQIIRPTGLLDPEIEVRKVTGQVDDLMGQIHKTIEKGGRVLVTTLTKKMAENLTSFYLEHGIKVRYLHSDIDTLERVEIINDLRAGEFDVLIGINLLREGLDLPEVMLVAILDADKEGFLRNESSLIQTIGRAARNAEGKVIMYADTITDSMRKAIDITEHRIKIQKEYNIKHNFVPKTIKKDTKNTLLITKKENINNVNMKNKDIALEIERVKGLMSIASKNLDFERAIVLREELVELKKLLKKDK